MKTSRNVKAMTWVDFRELFMSKFFPASARHVVTPQTGGSVDYPSTHGIQVDVGLPEATIENRAESPLYGELYPNTSPA